PVVLGLSTSNIAVIPTVDANGVPHRVTVEIDPVSGFQIPSGVGGVFAAFTLIGKPACSFEYQGRYTVP
ncbi:MAG TPA: hypothetical protein VEU62_19760, partial [Bryobacterales bacterium]|nr:hypothetical protein [Bryobacterales bacterium]